MNDESEIARVISRGSVWVNGPVRPIMIVGWVLAFGLLGFFEETRPSPSLTLFGAALWPLAFVVPFVLAWLWWSIAIPYWRVWAYAHCKDWDELERQAIARKLIWDETTPEGRLCAKTEIWSPKLKRRWEDLQRERGRASAR